MKKIAVIIVTYNPILEKLKNIIIDSRIDNTEIIIIDNNSDNISMFDFGCNIIKLEKNFGIAKAQNIGITKAKELNCSYVLFLDQDSNIDNKFISKMYYQYKLAEKKYGAKIVLGPVFYDDRYDFEYPQIIFDKYGLRKKIFASNINENLVQVSCLISSGMFMTLDIIDNIGSMDESLFIDYVDTEWCLRAGKKGIKFFVCNNINMRHEIGSANIHFLKWRIPVHNPARRYYRIRNSFYLFKYPHVHNIIAFREVFFSIIHQLILILICKDKVKNIKFLFSAVFSGLKAVFLNYIISFKRNGKYS